MEQRTEVIEHSVSVVASDEQQKKVSIEASGGTPPYTFALTQGTLPPNLQLNSLGTLFGTVQAAGGDTTIFVQVSDSARPPAKLTQAFDLQIATG